MPKKAQAIETSRELTKDDSFKARNNLSHVKMLPDIIGETYGNKVAQVISCTLHSYDNATMENWNHSSKVKAKEQVFECIEIYYNRKGLHSKLGSVSPEAFKTEKVAWQYVREIRARSIN
ncbi:MAG: hypothetical protein QX197_02290 [Methylococcaceae bacterium]